jgi:peptide deformylase
VTGYFARVAFDLTDHDAGNLIIDRVEEGTYDAQGIGSSRACGTAID